jgi:galactokinase
MVLIDGTLTNRDLTVQARRILGTSHPDGSAFGKLMDEHQSVLRDVLHISTPKIDRMIDAATNAGAIGAKINGSGGGGCMFAYAPEEPERVAVAVREAGGTAWVVQVDQGVTVHEETFA